ncbi:hypothetical protein BJX64DRAFT_71779 [Aspergillus heterothallicus]
MTGDWRRLESSVTPTMTVLGSAGINLSSPSAYTSATIQTHYHPVTIPRRLCPTILVHMISTATVRLIAFPTHRSFGNVHPATVHPGLPIRSPACTPNIPAACSCTQGRMKPVLPKPSDAMKIGPAFSAIQERSPLAGPDLPPPLRVLLFGRRQALLVITRRLLS